MRRNAHIDMSAGTKHWRGADDGDASTYSPATAPDVDPYAPGSLNYAVRTREQVMELPGGIVRVDYGASV